MSSVSDGENNAQATENTTSENDYPTDGDGYYYEQLPDGVPYTSGFSGSSGVASIVAAGEGDTESRVLYDNGNGTYSDDNGFRYSYQGNESYGQMPMEIPIVHGMMRIIISESNWSSVSFRASMEQWI